MKPYKPAFLVLFLSLALASCTRYVFRGAIKGQVVDASTGQPLENVKATLTETGDPVDHGSTVSDAMGIFRFAEYAALGSGLPALERPDPGPMPDSVLFYKAGYTKRKVSVAVLDDRDTTDLDTILIYKVVQ